MLTFISSEQHGFHKNRSCETQLLETVQDLTLSLNAGKQTDLLLLDFSKAFDRVSHQHLLYKLSHYGIRGPLHKWIRDFLQGRQQQVLLGNENSHTCSVLSGVRTSRIGARSSSFLTIYK